MDFNKVIHLQSSEISDSTMLNCIHNPESAGYMGSLLNVEYIFIADFMNETIHERIGVHPSPHALVRMKERLLDFI